MPVPSSFRAPDQPGGDGEMPRPSMGEAAGDDAMPRPAQAQVSGAGSMPVPGMPTAATAMPGTSSAVMELPRFGPPGGGGAGGSAYEPGTVEVQFRSGVTPTLAQAGTTPSLAAADASLDEMNDLLQRFGLVQAEPTFATSAAAATAAQDVARAQGIDAPHLAAFMTLHFAPDADTPRIAEELSRLPDVERAVAVPVALPPTLVAPRVPHAETDVQQDVPPDLAPAGPLSDPLVGTSTQVVLDPATGLENQWYVFRCTVDTAWSRSSGRNVVITDVDWGYRTTHQDLSTKIRRTYNSFDGTTDVVHGGSVSHGTAVAGLAGAAVDSRGMSGVAYDADLWAVQADSGTGTGLGGNAWARGIEWVRTTDSGGRRKVVILEVQTGAFGNYEQVPSVNAAIRTAIAAGVVVCVAAGNGDRDAGIDDSGNAIPETGSILVGATAYHATQNRRAGFSNWGPRITVACPGDASHDLTCNSSGDADYRNGFGGTSGATPKVAGVAALMLAVDPGLSHADVRRILSVTGSALTPDPGKPVGTFLDAAAAVRQASAGTTGRLEVFARGSDQALWHKWQTAPNGNWSGWHSQGGWIDMLEVGRNADGRMEVFARGSDGAVWNKWQVAPNSGWSGWNSLGGWVDKIVVSRNADGRMELFARGSDKALWHRWQVAPNSGWSGWNSLGGWIDDLVVGQNADGRMEVFARGSDQAVWHRWQTAPNGNWSGWSSLGGWVDRLAVGRNDDGRLELFARGSDGALWHKWQLAPNGTWSGWASRGGWIDLIDVGKNADGRLEVFARGADKALWHIWQVAPNGTWSGWATRGGWIDQLDVDQNNDGRLEVFTRGADKALWHIWQVAPNGTWSGWKSQGGWIDRLDIGRNAL
ncbi:S8 family serine peptidase [Blastococcus colisei]|nr:S8 family serine peptidase [Blastococcus colisei]